MKALISVIIHQKVKVTYNFNISESFEVVNSTPGLIVQLKKAAMLK